MPISSPLDINNCKVWLDMSDLTTLSGLSADTEPGNYRPVNTGELVGFIRDKSNNNNNFTNCFTTTATRPILINNGQNNRPVLRFNGTNYLTGLFTLPISEQTVFAVVSRRLTPNQAAGRVYTQTGGGPDTSLPNHYIPIVIDGNSNFSSYISGAFRSSILPPALSAFDVYTSTLSTNAVSGFVFNFLGGLSATTNIAYPIRRISTITNILSSRIGAGISTDSLTGAPTVFTFLTGDIGEIVVYDRFLTREERTSVEYYLAEKWRVPLTFFALNSGNWTDESIWSVSGTPLPLSDVFSNGYIININTPINVRGLLGIHTSPQNTINTNGTFLLLSSHNINVSLSGILAGTNTGLLINSPSTNNIIISANSISGGSTASSHGILLSSCGGVVTVFGAVSGGTNLNANGIALSGDLSGVFPKVDLTIVGDIFARTGHGVVNYSSDFITVTGNIISGGIGAGAVGILNNNIGYLFINSNIVGGATTTSHGVENRNTAGYISLFGNISASSSGGVGARNIGIIAVNGDIFASPSSNGLTGTGTQYLNSSFINASGGRQAVYTETFLVQKPPANFRTVFNRTYSVTNLLSSSETFLSPNWSQPFASVTVASNTQFPPLINFPLATASSIQTTNNTGIFAIRRHFTSISTVNAPYTFSIYAAPIVGNTGNLELYAITPGFNYGAIYDINTGNTLTVSQCAVSASFGFDSETGFRRFGLTFFTPANTTCVVEARITTSSSLSQHVVGNTTQGFHIWGAQLEQSGAMNGYVPTSNTSTTIAPSTFNPDRFKNEGSNNLIFYYPNNYSITNLPSIDDTVAGTVYAGYTPFGLVSTLTGNMVVPDRRAVKFNTLVGQTSGDSILYPEDSKFLWDVLESTIITPGSIGERLKLISSIFDAGSALNSMFI